jgi:c-di-GMP-binding flagellar brake protein YcgR
MPWFTAGPASLNRVNERRFYRQSIELPIVITVGGLPAPVYGTLINISESGCRFRSLIVIDRNRSVEFQLQRAGRPALALRGHVVTRATPVQGGGSEYGVKFDTVSDAERESLAKEIAEMQRREAAARNDGRNGPVQPLDEKQRRRNVRTLASFPIRYRLPNRGSEEGDASDISAGGLRLRSAQTLAIDSALELRFTLPSEILGVYPPAAERAEISPFGQRRVRIPDNRRPFSELTIRGRVVSRFAQTRTHTIYGVQFLDLDGYAREEIARFMHAVQLSKLRVD